MSINSLKIVSLLALLSASYSSFGQNQFTGANAGRAPLPSVPFLKVAPDARGAAMGDAGVATSGDANAMYWNPAKLATLDKSAGMSFTYTPWLRQLVNDMTIYYLTGYKKVGKNQAIGVAINYFDQGVFNATTSNGTAAGDYYSRDFAASVTYSTKLTQKMAAGVSLRYINSNPAGNVIINGVALKPATTAAADVAIYYNSNNPDRQMNWGWGVNISNIGGQVSYGGASKNYIPTNIRLGTASTYKIDQYNKIVLAIDFNKLMIPTPPVYDNAGNITAGNKNYKTQTTLQGILGSFADAPDGLKEEFQEIATSIGAEYWYNDAFAARLGFHSENAIKASNQTYFSAGFGAKIANKYALDFAYLLPTGGQNSPLANTLRISLLFNFDKKDRAADNAADETDSSK